MVNLLLFPFRLLGWVCVQLTRIVGLLIIQPLRLMMAPLGVLSSRITLVIVFVAYGLLALRLSSPYPVGEWYTTIIHYTYPADVTIGRLIVDTLTFRETDNPMLRNAQWWIAGWTIIVFALFKITRNHHKRLRERLAKKAQQLVQMKSPSLWTVRPTSTLQGAGSRVASPAKPQPNPVPRSPEPKKPPITTHARYGLSACAMNESHAVIEERLPPELRAFISQV